MNYELNDSGNRRTFDTGAQRDRATDKSRPDLISPVFLERLGMVLTKGAIKYDERNWEKGMPLSEFLASAMRHLIQLMDGLENEDHAAQCAWNLMAYIHIEHRIRTGSLPVELDNMPREMNLGKKNLESSLTTSKKVPMIGHWDPKTGIRQCVPCCPKCYRETPNVQGNSLMVGFVCQCGEEF